jgi:hypothetical protein
MLPTSEASSNAEAGPLYDVVKDLGAKLAQIEKALDEPHGDAFDNAGQKD